MSLGGKYVELRIEFINPKSINFSSPLMVGSCARINAHKHSPEIKKTSSSNHIFQWDLISFLKEILFATTMFRARQIKRIPESDQILKGTIWRVPRRRDRYDMTTAAIIFENM